MGLGVNIVLGRNEQEGVGMEWRKELEQVNGYRATRFGALISYAGMSFAVSYLAYKRYMYGNKLLFGVSYVLLGVIPTAVLFKAVRSQNDTDKIVFFLQNQSLID